MNRYAAQLICEAVKELDAFADRIENLDDQLELDRIVRKLKTALEKLNREKS